MTTNIRCLTCEHYLGDLSCMAFDNIPEIILLGNNNHSEPLKNQDNDFVYEPKAK